MPILIVVISVYLLEHFLNKVNAATKVVIDELVDVRENGITEEELKK